MAAKRQTREETLMTRDTSPIRGAFHHGEHWHCCGGFPSESPGLATGDSLLDVQRTQQLLHVGDDRLDLDNQKEATDGLVCQQVDATSIAIVVEAHLRRGKPMHRLETAGETLAEMCVVGVTQSSELGTTESGVPLEPQVQRSGNPPNAPYRKPLDVSAFDEAQEASAYASPACKILLPPTTPVP